MWAKYVLASASRISQKSETIYSQNTSRARARALSRSYFYGLVAADVHVNRRVSCTPPGFTYPPRVLWSLVTPYGVDGAQRVARRSLRVQKAERRSRAQSFILETLSLSLFFILYFSTSISRLLQRRIPGLFCV